MTHPTPAFYFTQIVPYYLQSRLVVYISIQELFKNNPERACTVWKWQCYYYVINFIRCYTDRTKQFVITSACGCGGGGEQGAWSRHRIVIYRRHSTIISLYYIMEQHIGAHIGCYRNKSRQSSKNCCYILYAR